MYNPQMQNLTGFCSVDTVPSPLECYKYSKCLAFPATVLPPPTQSDMTPEYSWNAGRAEPGTAAGTATVGSCLITRIGTTQP